MKPLKPLEIARSYITRGWSPVPVPHQHKGPVIKGWQNLRITEGTAPQYFIGKKQNIGVLLGEPSTGLVDLDMDWPEAAQLRHHFLPATLTFGRVSNPTSHALVISPGAVTRKFQLSEVEGGTVLEIRSDGTQTVFPGSTHTSGEAISFDNKNPLAVIDAKVLHQLGAEWAAASVLRRHWADGVKDDLAAAVCGTLLRAGWSAEKVNRFVEIISTEAADHDTPAKLKAERLAEKLESGAATFRGCRVSGKSSESVQRTRSASGWVCVWTARQSVRLWLN